MHGMRKFRNRRGVFVVLFGILFTALMTAAAMAIDFSRIWAMRNELQTSADASSLAAAVQLSTTNNAYTAVDSAARYFAAANRAMGAPVNVDLVHTGQWDDTGTPPNGFIDGAVPPNAVKVTVSHPTSGLIMSALGITAPNVHATAIAWADAPVSTTNCIRPWAIPYEVLMGRVNPLRLDDPSISGAPYSRANLTRPFDPNKDMAVLRNAGANNLRFSLKLGQNSNGNNGNINDVLVNGQPGNFQAVALPKYWDFATQAQANPGPDRGGSAYADAIAGKNCYSISIGDSLMTETGNKVGPTVTAADKSDPKTAPYGICDSIIDDKKSPDNGKCMNAASSSGFGVEIKTAFYFCPSSCSGRSIVSVNLLGSFTLERIYPNGDTGPSPAWDKSQIVGVFNPVSDIGPVGGTATTLRRVILVK